eukprot:15454471-Alexandrium_andersonii.AAC.1
MREPVRSKVREHTFDNASRSRTRALPGSCWFLRSRKRCGASESSGAFERWAATVSIIGCVRERAKERSIPTSCSSRTSQARPEFET